MLYCSIGEFLPPIPLMIPSTKPKAPTFLNFLLTHPDVMSVLKERKAKKEAREKGEEMLKRSSAWVNHYGFQNKRPGCFGGNATLPLLDITSTG